MRVLILFIACSLIIACDADASRSDSSATIESKIYFADKTKESGVEFKHSAGLSKNKWLPEILSAGVAVADFNRDGAPDLVFANGGVVFAEQGSDRSAPRAKTEENKLFINDGKGKFSDATRDWNLTGFGYGQGVAVGDIDNDGLTDLFLTNFEGDNRLLRNTGNRFEDFTDQAGISADGKWATSAGFGDFDNDGDLDLFIVKYVKYNKQNHITAYDNKMPQYSAPGLYEGVSDQILLNDGRGGFTDVSKAAGIEGSRAKGLALAIGDIDKDGDSDIYVANDTTPNHLWINDGKGKFEDHAGFAGVAYSEVGLEEGSMGADFSDFDGNGLPDITVTNFQDESTALYSQVDKMLFREISDPSGIGSSARLRLSFGIEFFDADNDGDEDIIMANGHINDTIDVNSDSVTFAQQNSLFENKGNGRFLDVSDVAGPAVKDSKVSRGLAVADFDSDGMLDYVVANNNSPAQVAYNETRDPGNFVGFWLEGTTANRNSVGARLIVTVGHNKIEREIMGAQSYMSVSDFRVLIGLGGEENIKSL